MKRIGTAIVVAVLLGAIVAHAQTPGSTPRQEIPSTQPRDNSSETTGAGTRSQRELGPNNIVPPDGATDRAPPSKLRPGELPTSQNPKEK
jgi:hypothetical protein